MESDDAEALTRLGPEPPPATVGEPITVSRTVGGNSIFWRGGLEPLGELEREVVRTAQDGNMEILVERVIGPQRGLGSLNIDFVLYSAVGIDLSWATKAALETLRLPARLLAPFLVLIGLSLITRRLDPGPLDRYYAKMRTPVRADPAEDRRVLEEAYRQPDLSRKLFPGTDLEFYRPSAKDIIGFTAAVAICVLIIGLLVWLAGLGA